MRKIVKLLIIIIFLSPTWTYSQSMQGEDKFRFFSMKLHSGKHYYTGTQLSDALKNGYASIELRFGWQPTGKREWEGEHGYPSFGIGTYHGYVGDVDIFGSPHAVFGFITFPFTKLRRNTFQIEPALGLTYNLKPYNPDHNAMNDAIGSKFAVYFAMHIGGKYQLNREIDLLYGYDLTHFSNGRTVTPNLGLNMMGFSFGGRYNFNRLQHKVDKSINPVTIVAARPTLPPTHKPRKIREHNISIYQAFGTVQNKDDAATNHRYLVSSTVVDYQFKFNTKHAVSAGFDAFYDASATDTAEYTANKEAQEKYFPAIHAGYHFMFWKLAIGLQVGTHLSKMGKELKGTMFIRPAVRYEFAKRFYGQVGLKTMNGATADWIEFGIGWKVFRNQFTAPAR